MGKYLIRKKVGIALFTTEYEYFNLNNQVKFKIVHEGGPNYSVLQKNVEGKKMFETMVEAEYYIQEKSNSKILRNRPYGTYG